MGWEAAVIPTSQGRVVATVMGEPGQGGAWYGRAYVAPGLPQARAGTHRRWYVAGGNGVHHAWGDGSGMSSCVRGDGCGRAGETVCEYCQIVCGARVYPGPVLP